MMTQPDLEAAMRTLAARTETSKPLPDSDLVWIRALARARLRQYESATHSVLAAEVLGSMVCAITGILVLFALRPGMAAALAMLDQTLVRLGAVAVIATMAVIMVMIRMLLFE